MAFIIEGAGGKGSDGVGNLLDLQPSGLHDRVCCFLGSYNDISSLEEYGDVQQSPAKYNS